MLSALDAGAIDFVQKPTALATEKVFDMADELVAKVRRRHRPRSAAAPPRRRVNTVLIEQIDVVDLESFEGSVGDFFDVCRPTTQPALSRRDRM